MQILHKSGSSAKDLDHWFTSVRKRIGWNRLRIKYFSNKRRLIVDAATQFFNGRPTEPVPSSSTAFQTLGTSSTPNSFFDGFFIEIENEAKALYSRKFLPSSSNFDPALIKPSTQRKKSRKNKPNPEHFYPSPERSLSRSPGPQETPSSSRRTLTRKRSPSLSPEPEHRPLKRSR